MKIFDCHSDTMADIRNRVFAGEHDVIRNRHLPLYKKGGVSGLLYAIYLAADLGDPQRTMLEILRTSFAEFDAVQDRLGISRRLDCPRHARGFCSVQLLRFCTAPSTISAGCVSTASRQVFPTGSVVGTIESTLSFASSARQQPYSAGPSRCSP